MVLAGPVLGVSANYLVILPVMVCAIAFGVWGGLAAGIVALPANLLFFSLLGHAEFSPASKPIAEVSGIVLGAVLGYLSDYFRKLDAEITLRVWTEESLVLALRDKDVLLKEVNHRVRNNLNIIKSLIRLQASRSKDPLFTAATKHLQQRIFAISLVHEQLFSESEPSSIKPSEYLSQLVGNITSGYGGGKAIDVGLAVRDDGALPVESAASLGLILNEIVTNSIKHAFDGTEKPSIRLEFGREGDRWILSVKDNGSGFDGRAAEEGLGMKLIEALCRQIDGACAWSNSSGTLFRLEFPAF
jgi:two-component sensor histidine kinase